MAKDLLVDLMKDLGADYDYTSGSFSVKTGDLGEFEQASLVIRVEEVVGTNSTFKIETSIDDIVYVAVDHSSLTGGMFTVTNAIESHKFQFQDFPDRYIKVTFTPNTSTGIVKSVKVLVKQ